MKKFVIFSALVVALYYGRPYLFSGLLEKTNKGAYDSSGDPEVIIFTSPGCGAPCDNSIRLLAEKRVHFDNLDVNESPENMELFRRLGGGRSLPYIVVGSSTLVGFNRSDITHALARHFGIEYLDRNIRVVVEEHFNTDGSPAVIMYATEWCAYCQKAREFFAKNGINYTEVDVEKSSEGKRRYDALEPSGYPLIYLGQIRINGFDQRKLERELKAL